MQTRNPFAPDRPPTAYEIESEKNAMLEDYHRGVATLPGTGRMFSKSLEYTPDEIKYQLANVEEQLSNVQGQFELHELEEMVGQKSQKPNHRPFGNFPGGHPGFTKTMVTKDVLDSSITAGQGGGVLVRTDMVPTINLWFNTRFPALERIPRVPANGIVHTWLNELDLGDANDDFIDEYGCPVISHGTYFRGETNIAIIAVERGVTLKLQYAITQSGMNLNGNQTIADVELQNAILSRAKILQKAFYYGTTDDLHTGNDEFGKTFLNGFNGLRVLISNHANTVHSGFYPTGTGPVIGEVQTGGSIAKAIDAVAGTIVDNGGMPSAIHLSTRAEQKLRDEGIDLIRYTQDDAVVGGGLVLGGRVRAVDTVAGLLPVVIIPGHGIGTYNIGASDGSSFANGTNVEDVYVLSEQQLQFVYLGSEDPVPLEIPTGLPSPDGTGCLTRRFMVWWMVGLAMPTPIFQGKVRILTA